MHNCRFPFAHDPHSCDCTPSKLSRDIARFEANAASRKEMARGSTLALYLILAVSVSLFAWSASVGLGRAENSYQEDARV